MTTTGVCCELAFCCFLSRKLKDRCNILRVVQIKAGKTQALYHHNVNIQEGGLIKDQSKKDSHIHHSIEKFIH